MTFSERISALQQRVNAEINTLFQGSEPEILYDPMFHLLGSGGKRIRPLLMLLSCQATGGSIEDAMDAAAAVELLHTFTLVHDDIMAHADSRRAKPRVPT